MVSVFGTMAADVLHVGLGVPVRRLDAGSSSPSSPSSSASGTPANGPCPSTASAPAAARLFYWAAVLATFALGTAAGDLTATVGFGYLGSVVLFAAAIACPPWPTASAPERGDRLLDRLRHHPPPRRLLADWMALAHTRGGLGLGTGLSRSRSSRPSSSSSGT